ncbi:MAG: hypothetical protein WAU36_03360 [Cyclobacteriaceae bacterium]
MIVDGNFRLTGLKQIDITSEVLNLVSSAKNFIIICGYGFTRIGNPRSILGHVLSSSAQVKHCILPIGLFRGKDANRGKALEMIRHGMSVSIEEKNHSKWIMSENEIYYGSANFTIDSLTNKIEVASFRSFKDNDPILHEFKTFTLSSIKKMSNTSTRKKIKGVIMKNAKLLTTSRSLIKRYNPSIEKVYQTIDSINEVRSALHELAANCYWLLDDSQYKEITWFTTRLNTYLRLVGLYGSELIESKEINNSILEQYNRVCDNFYRDSDKLQGVTGSMLLQSRKVPEFATLNRKLARSFVSAFKE